VLPVAFSLTVTFMSAITILGIPAEVYTFGTMYAWYVDNNKVLMYFASKNVFLLPK